MSALGNEIRNVAREIRRSDTRAVLNHLASKVDDLAPDPKGTPTDDERILRASIHGDVDAIRALDRLLRRTVQGEPFAKSHPDHSKLGPSACPACDFDPMKIEPSDATVTTYERAAAVARSYSSRPGDIADHIASILSERAAAAQEGEPR